MLTAGNFVCFPESGAIARSQFLPGLHTLVHFSESTDQWICFCYRTQGHVLVQGSGHRVGAGAGLALEALGVPTHPVGSSSGIFQGLADGLPDEVLRGQQDPCSFHAL